MDDQLAIVMELVNAYIATLDDMISYPYHATDQQIAQMILLGVMPGGDIDPAIQSFAQFLRKLAAP